MSDRTVLAFDTSAAHCAAGLLFEGRIVTLAEPMRRGQAERLMPFLQELLEDNALRWSDLDRIGVGVGPGNFTGIRISVSAARGLALGIDKPAIGVSSLEALIHGGADVAAVNGPRDTAYIQRAGGLPEIVPLADVPLGTVWADDVQALVASICQIAANAPSDSPAPAPLYLKPADAAPARDAPPRILDDA